MVEREKILAPGRIQTSDLSVTRYVIYLCATATALGNKDMEHCERYRQIDEVSSIGTEKSQTTWCSVMQTDVMSSNVMEPTRL